jgi:hypothetical protein
MNLFGEDEIGLIELITFEEIFLSPGGSDIPFIMSSG